MEIGVILSSFLCVLRALASFSCFRGSFFHADESCDRLRFLFLVGMGERTVPLTDFSFDAFAPKGDCRKGLG